MVILAPSCNLDVYINYCYNQLTHTLLEVCVCVCACVHMFVLFIFLFFFFFFCHGFHIHCVFLFVSLSPAFLCKVGAIHHRLRVCACVHMRICVSMQACICVCVHTWNQYWGQMIILLQQDLYTQR